MTQQFCHFILFSIWFLNIFTFALLHNNFTLDKNWFNIKQANGLRLNRHWKRNHVPNPYEWQHMYFVVQTATTGKYLRLSTSRLDGDDEPKMFWLWRRLFFYQKFCSIFQGFNSIRRKQLLLFHIRCWQPSKEFKVASVVHVHTK